MNWKNLKENKCPQCNKDITWGMGKKVAHVRHQNTPLTAAQVDGSEITAPEIATEIVITHTCGFAIRESKYKEIVSNIITKELEDELENDPINY